MSKIFEIKTIQSSAIKCMIEALKELLTDTVLEINETGIKIVTMDNAHVILVHLKLHADKFEYYKSLGLEIGFDIVESGPLVRSSYHADEQARLAIR